VPTTLRPPLNHQTAPTGDMWLEDRPFTSSPFPKGHSPHLPSTPVVAFAAPFSRCAKFRHRHHSPRVMHPTARGVLNARICGAYSLSVRPHPSVEYDGYGGTWWDFGPLSGIFLSKLALLLPSFPPFSGFGSVVHFLLPLLNLLIPHRHINRFLQSSSLAFLCSPIYYPLCCPVHICRSIARIQLFINYGTSLLLSYTCP
jgi:hypothetical protein